MGDTWNYSEEVIVEIVEVLKDRPELYTILREMKYGDPSDKQRTLLAEAIHRGRVEAAKKLTEFGPDFLINLNDRNDNVFHCCCESSFNEIKGLVSNLIPGHVELLNQFNLEGDLPIHIAIFRRRKEIIEMLLQEKSMDVAARNKDGNNILHLSLI